LLAKEQYIILEEILLGFLYLLSHIQL
jgi:hypothetical protein